MRRLTIIAILLTAGCENPHFGVGASVNSHGNVHVSPTASGNIGGLDVVVSG